MEISGHFIQLEADMGALLNVYLVGEGTQPTRALAVKCARSLAPEFFSTLSISVSHDGTIHSITEADLESADEGVLYFGDGAWPRPSVSVSGFDQSTWFLGLALPDTEGLFSLISQRVVAGLGVFGLPEVKILAAAVGGELQADAESSDDLISLWEHDPECHLLLVEANAFKGRGAPTLSSHPYLVRLKPPATTQPI